MDFSEFQWETLNYLAYFATTTNQIEKLKSGKYVPKSIPELALWFYRISIVNAMVKTVFIALLVTDYYGPILFEDKIVALDYLLIICLVTITWSMYFNRYPLYEIIGSTWEVLNKAFLRLKCEDKVRQKVDFTQKIIVLTNLCIFGIGGISVTMQYFSYPKYCAFTYSIIEMDNTPLRLAFFAHEFVVTDLGWIMYFAGISIALHECISISSILDQMTERLNSLTDNSKDRQNEFDYLIHNFKMLTVLCNQINDTIAFKTLLLHIIAGCQFVSDVYAATHIIKLPGATFADVQFFIEDGILGAFVMLRTYLFMSRMAPASARFLKGFKTFIMRINESPQQVRRLRRRIRSLKVISLKVGPCHVPTEAMLSVLDKMTTYFVAAALW
ncbi:unnamed protein product [Orchesella dallaii]|uniref:Odorant receptor n=1 Tax=Orchesella dallaii TaxID=48710 RepID=A0ABP1PT05_9HEXA